MSFAIYPSLRDRPVLITGGASGIGASMVEHFAQQGAKVAFLDIDRAAGAAVAERTGARFEACDLTDVAALQAVIARLAAEMGAFRVLVNNAARDDRHSIAEVTPDYWDNRIAVNLRHQFFAAQAVVPGMAAAGGGSIINMGSTSWLMGNGGFPVYVTAKSAIHGMTRGLARDLGPQRIRCNVVLPGWVMTERQESLWVTPEGIAGHLARQCIPEKLFEPDIARMVLWLAADDSRMATGQSFIVDGGSS